MAGSRLRRRDFFEVAVIGNLVFTSSLEDADKSVDFKRVRYVFDAIHTPDGDVCLWRPEGQSMLETLRALVTSYCDGKSRG